MQEQDALAAYCVDNAVRAFGIIVENALQERVKTGAGKQENWIDKYTLAQLLSQTFTLPPTRPQAPAQNGIQTLLLMAQQRGSGVKLWTGNRMNDATQA